MPEWETPRTLSLCRRGRWTRSSSTPESPAQHRETAGSSTAAGVAAWDHAVHQASVREQQQQLGWCVSATARAAGTGEGGIRTSFVGERTPTGYFQEFLGFS